jgi:hypothetical protein
MVRGYWAFEHLIWRGAFTLSDRIDHYHVITRDELYDLRQQDWVGSGHLALEYILKYIVFLLILLLCWCCKINRLRGDYEFNEACLCSISSLRFGREVVKLDIKSMSQYTGPFSQTTRTEKISFSSEAR